MTAKRFRVVSVFAVRLTRPALGQQLTRQISWAISSAGEHYIDIVGVTGSIPVSPTIFQPLISITYWVISEKPRTDKSAVVTLKGLLWLQSGKEMGNFRFE